MEEVQRQVHGETSRIGETQSHNDVIILHLISGLIVVPPLIDEPPQTNEVDGQHDRFKGTKIKPEQQKHAYTRERNTYQRMDWINGCGGIENVEMSGRTTSLFPLYPPPHALSILFPSKTGDSLIEPSQSLTQRAIARGLPRVLDEEDSAELTAECLAHGFGHPFSLSRQLDRCVQHTVGD